jgi:catechol 2,3-dioxygenase-like lactoylglutathione lyase family enzyme
MVEKISAVNLRVANMEGSVRFYRDVLGLETLYRGEGSYFTSLRTKDHAVWWRAFVQALCLITGHPA